MVDLQNKNILITGSSSGIGRNAAYGISQIYDAHVIIVARRDDVLRQMKAEIGQNCTAISCDLEDLESIQELFVKLSEADIVLDGMVHCAGLSPLMSVAENDIEMMLKTYSINLFSFIELVKYFQQRAHSNDGASIVAMSSIAAQYACNRQTVYAGSKAALEESIQCMAKELIGRRIRVNAIAAGAVETEMLTELEKQSDTLQQKLENLYPFGVIRPNQITNMIAYLLSAEAENITGSIIKMDSGFSIAK